MFFYISIFLLITQAKLIGEMKIDLEWDLYVIEPIKLVSSGKENSLNELHI